MCEENKTLNVEEMRQELREIIMSLTNEECDCLLKWLYDYRSAIE